MRRQVLSSLTSISIKKDLLIIDDGQSNNPGQGEVSALPASRQGVISNNIKIYYNGQNQSVEAGVNSWGQALLSSGGEWPNSWHGSNIELAYQLSVNQPTRKAFFVVSGRGGRPLGADAGTQDFAPASNELHTYMIDNVTAYLTLLGRDISEFEVWYSWMQGEYDCRTGEDVKANAYEVNIDNKIIAVKDDLGHQDINVIINVINSTIPRDAILIPIVRQSQIDYAANTANVTSQLSETWSLKGDGLHFDSVGQLSKGLGEYNIITSS